MFTIHVRMWSNNNIILIFNCGYNLFILITVESPETSILPTMLNGMINIIGLKKQINWIHFRNIMNLDIE